MSIKILGAILLAITLFGQRAAFAVVSFSMSGTGGFYRDIQQNNHFPLYYSISYSGAHSSGVESYLDVFLNNDFAVNTWSVIPSQLLIIYPLTEGQKPFRRSRIQLGRQFFAEGFDLSLLDGIELPIYWSSTGGFILYGGNSHLMDLLDPAYTPIIGGSVFQKILGTQIRAGYSARRNNLAEKIFNGSFLCPIEGLLLNPQILIKGELDQEEGVFSQTFSELMLNPFDVFSIGYSYSKRLPRRIAPDQNVFLYDVFAQSSQETQSLTSNLQLAPTVLLQGIGRVMRYDTSLKSEYGSQEQASLSWLFTPYQSVTPVFDHVVGYGGELWDSGISYKIRMTDTTEGRIEFAAAYFDKINTINGWAYNVRSGLSFLLAPRLTAMGWVELDRNPIYQFDGRVIANITYFN